MRRSLIRLAAVILVGSCAFPMPSNAATRVESLGRVQSSGSRANGWPQTFFDAAHTGYNPRETIISPSNVSQLQLLWGYPVPGEISALVLENGRIYAQSSGPASHGPILVALDASTGALVWTIAIGETGNVAQQSIAAINRRVFTNCTSYPYHQGVCAYDATTGKREWIYSIGCSSKTPACADLESLVYADATVYFVSQASGSGNNALSAVDAGTGNALWTYTSSTYPPWGYSALAVDNGLVYFGCDADGLGGICALNQSDGSLAWSSDAFGVSSGFAGGMTFGKGTLYLNADDTVGSTYAAAVTALDGTTGASLWQYPYSENGSYENAFPAALARNLLYATGSNDDVYALRSGSGSMLWAAIPGDSAPSIANGVLYVNRPSSASGAAAVAAYDASNGASLWTGPSFRISYAPITPPIVANGILYVSNATCGGVCAYGLPPSNLRASQPRKPML